MHNRLQDYSLEQTIIDIVELVSLFPPELLPDALSSLDPKFDITIIQTIYLGGGVTKKKRENLGEIPN